MSGETFWRLQVHEVLPSTSDLCRTLAEAGEPEGLAVIVGRQTAGRGTQGRQWVSPTGNLYLSVLLRPLTPVRQVGMWGLLAAVALAEALSSLVPADALRLKWPNDVLLNGGKLAGLLSEASISPSGQVTWIIIGIGVNLCSAPDVPDRATACVGPAAPAPEKFAADLLQRLAAWRRMVLLDGFAPVREAWLAYGPALGSDIAVRRGETEQQGAFAGLRDDGALLLSQAGRVVAVASGET